MNFLTPFFLAHNTLWSYAMPGAFYPQASSLVATMRSSTGQRKIRQWRRRTARLFG